MRLKKDLYSDVKSRFKNIDIEKMKKGSPEKGFNHKHLRSISNVVGSRKSSIVNELVSPYSILRKQDEKAVDDALQKITSPFGYKGNRA